MSAQTNKPMMGIIYDTLSGAYILTASHDEYEKLGKDINKLDKEYKSFSSKVKDEELQKLEDIRKQIEKSETRRKVLKERLILDPIVFDLAIKSVQNAPQYETLYKRLEFYKVHPYSGRALISSVFPEDFDYNANGVVIKNGIVVSGILGKDSLGNKDGSIIAEMVKQLGGMITVDFMSDIQFVVRDFLMQHGLSVGIDDCIPDDDQFRNDIDKIVTEAVDKVITLSYKATNKVAAEQQERKICETLDIAKNNGDGIVKRYFNEDNNILIMANSGAKGTTFNAIQMSSALGPQKVSGKRILANLYGDRSLPCVEPGSKDPRDRGYVTSSFGSGLELKEFFFHSQGGREGLTDTAINTSETGFLQHQIIKSAEDVYVSPDGSVRSADLAIVQFVYGDDGFDSSETSTIKIQDEKIPFFRNFDMLAAKVNRKYTAGI
jgi:DNA-directed RNA polymerase beta' subunit